MNEVLNRLADLFPPPDQPTYPVSPGDFTRIPLIHEPPQDLRGLFELYGEGEFECKVGDSIRLMFPTTGTAEIMRLAGSAFFRVLTDGLMPKAYFGPSAKWFEALAAGQPSEFLLWGNSVNGVYLFAVWLPDPIGWVTLVYEGTFFSTACFFGSPSAFLLDVFTGDSILSGFFPKAERPFRFVKSDRLPS